MDKKSNSTYHEVGCVEALIFLHLAPALTLAQITARIYNLCVT